MTDVDPVATAVSSDRADWFEPQIVKKRQQRLGGDERALLLSDRSSADSLELAPIA